MMANFPSLSGGVIGRIMNGEDVPEPVLQIMGIKKISTNADSERYRLLISDGKYFNSFVMLGSQLNSMQREGRLSKYTIVRLDKYITSIVGQNNPNKRVLIVNGLTVLASGADVGRKIGDPISYENAAKQDPTTKLVPSAEPQNNTTRSTTVNLPQPTPPANKNNDVSAGTSTASVIHPIASLSPYQNKWVIKARVTSKGPIRTWSNARGEGKFFNMDLMDKSGEIRATAFKSECDKFYDRIQVDHVYFISKCRLNTANKQYSTLKNDYELAFTYQTTVQECGEIDDADFPKMMYDLVPISQVANMENNAPVDTIGICKEVGELQSLTSRTTNKELKKRDLMLVDMSNAAVNLTLWNDDAVNFDGHGQPVILLKGSRVNEFNGGKSLNIGSVMKINPDIPEAHKLRGWFDNGGGDNIVNMVSARTGGGNFNTEWLTFRDVSARNFGAGDKPDYFQCKAVVHTIKSENSFYKACPQSECQKKVVEEGDGQYRCERCNAVYPNFKYRLLINMSIGNWTSSRWVTAFNEAGEQLLKHSAQEIVEALEHDPTKAEAIFSSITFSSHIFKLRCKNEFYADMTRNKVSVQSLMPINYKEYNKYLLTTLKDITGIGSIE